MNDEEKRIARRAVNYLKKHGLDFNVTCNLGVDVPPEIQVCVDGYMESCFPTDPDEVCNQVIEMIETELAMAATNADVRPTCPDCGVAVGQCHVEECDVEQCTVCKGQRISCECDGHDPQKAIWTGKWPYQEKVQP